MDIYLKTKDVHLKDLCNEMKNLVIKSIKSVENKLKG
jgi:hypothetical protein